MNELIKAVREIARKAGETILHQAVKKPGNERLVAHLLTTPYSDVNARRYDGRTAYQIAYGLNLLTMQQLLLRKGADDYVDFEEDQGEEMMETSDETSDDAMCSPPPLIPKTPPRVRSLISFLSVTTGKFILIFFVDLY